MLGHTSEIELWRLLQLYRQRYQIDDRIAPILDLEKSLQRRRLRAAALSRRLEELEKQIDAVRSDLAAVRSEVNGTRTAGALLIEEILDQIRMETGEAWSPAPLRGFRVWRIEDGKVMGNQVRWPTPTLTSKCLRDIPGEDLPHPVSMCGPPACGIYAVKDLGIFGDGLAEGMVDRSIVGVVEMTGKVIEHEDGYRSNCATVVAVAAKYRSLRLLTEDPETIEDLFADPVATMSRVGKQHEQSNPNTRKFLESACSKEEEWI